MILFFQFLCYDEKRWKDETRFNFHKGDYVSLRSFLDSVDWSAIQELSTDEQWNNVTECVTSGIKKCIPKINPANKIKKLMDEQRLGYSSPR